MSEKHRCTWVGCEEAAIDSINSKDGKPWCWLCQKHMSETDSAIVAGDVKAILRNWVKAHGGANALAQKM